MIGSNHALTVRDKMFKTKKTVLGASVVDNGDAVLFHVKERILHGHEVERYSMKLPAWVIVRAGWHMVERYVGGL